MSLPVTQSEWQQLNDKLDRVLSMVAELHATQTACNARCTAEVSAICKQVAEHHITLYGVGDAPGLVKTADRNSRFNIAVRGIGVWLAGVASALIIVLLLYVSSQFMAQRDDLRNRQPLPIAPVAPVLPVAPIAPIAPVAPVAPVLPLAPVLPNP